MVVEEEVVVTHLMVQGQPLVDVVTQVDVVEEGLTFNLQNLMHFLLVKDIQVVI